MNIDWPTIVFDPIWLQKLSKITSDRFHDEVLAEEAATYVIENLSNNHWQRLKTFSGDAKPHTYLYSISLNLIEEFARNKFGRVRPPNWLKQEGEMWLKIWKMLCLERQSKINVIDHLSANEKRDPHFIEAVIRTIKGRLPWCGVKLHNLPIEDAESFDHEQQMNTTLEQTLDIEKLQEFEILIAELLENWSSPSNPTMTVKNKLTMQLINDISTNVSIDDEDLLIIKMAFQEGLKLNVIASSLNIPSYQPGRVLKRVFAELAQILKKNDPSFNQFDDILRSANL